MLNMYRSVFFEILSIYRKFSSDPHIGIFALGLFSAIIAFFFITIISVIEFYFYDSEYTNESVFLLGCIGVAYLGNTFLFLFNRGRQEELFEQYQRRRSLARTIIVVVFVVSVFSSAIWIATKFRERNMAQMELVEQASRTNK